jgi:uncharacterized protein
MSADSNHPPQPDGADPSMEEILASIRKILNEDDAPSAEAAHTPSPAPEDVLVLDESMMVPPEETAPTAKALPPPAAPADIPANREGEGREPVELVAPEAAAAAASSLGSLVRTLAAGRATPVYSSGPTLEDMVRGELRPMLKAWMDAHLIACTEEQVRAELRPLLKTWLDGNLPSLVERLVRAEIEKVVGRAVP